ncbi:hypothetical protein MINTMi27_15120 [Mycobacterium intracellulare]|uniref:hypothetical protein n=1 Tax=Mycobacterium intracellulare TaxID=1767 RepID=UPI0019265CCD|nr:hypothetical protein [Mycobacterium intracellulare]BCP41419.1 hypothetical protein MINTMi27_15120 [Mycobacterium intracellulare]
MGIPNATHQVASDAIAALGGYISLHLSPAGTTGANEATGGGYSRQLSSPWSPDGVGDNSGPQVNIPCAAGTYVEGGIFSTQTGSTISVPSGLNAVGSDTGGTFAAGTYYWKITAKNFAGETTPSLEASATLTGSASSCDLTWSAVSGADEYCVYRGTTSGSENTLVATVTTNSYNDTGSAGTAATLPISNTASSFIGSTAFNGGSVTVSGTGGSINVTPTITA